MLYFVQHFKHCDLTFQQWLPCYLRFLEHFYVSHKQYILKITEKCNQFNSLSQGTFFIYFLWIPSHTGIRGNEEIDYIAKIALDFNYATLPECSLRIFSNFSEKNRSHKLITKERSVRGTTYFNNYYSNKTTPRFFKKQSWKENLFPL